MSADCPGHAVIISLAAWFAQFVLGVTILARGVASTHLGSTANSISQGTGPVLVTLTLQLAVTVLITDVAIRAVIGDAALGGAGAGAVILTLLAIDAIFIGAAIRSTFTVSIVTDESSITVVISTTLIWTGARPIILTSFTILTVII